MNTLKEQEQINTDFSGKMTAIATLETSRKDEVIKKSTDGVKSDEDLKLKIPEEKPKIELPVEEELLGSVTTLSSPALRASARVIQKLKMDSIRPTSPPLSEKKESTKDERQIQKTPSQPKSNKVIWSNIERNLFFEALNEYGKDFESISHYINTKQKRKNITDSFYKTKENVRQIYHQTFHKLSKYLRFSDDVKKHVQELYGLINYGEMRKKLVFINQKDCMKLKELVYKGSVTLRVKGKNIRIKTPSCKALRKLNQLEEWQEEIKLPSKVDVFLKPANIAAWATVQNLAQNPRIKTALPLQKRVVSLLKTLQTRWRSREARLCDQTMTLQTTVNQHQIKSTNSDGKLSNDSEVATAATSPTINCPSFYTEPLLCFAPPADATIHRPMVNLSEFLSSYSICLNSYEDRIGVSMKGETLCTERLNSLKEIIKTNAKRQRHDSGSSEKKSPDGKRMKLDGNNVGEQKIQQNTIKLDEVKESQLEEFLVNGDVSIFGTHNNHQQHIMDGVTQISSSYSPNTANGEITEQINGGIVNNNKTSIKSGGSTTMDSLKGCSSLMYDLEIPIEVATIKKEPITTQIIVGDTTTSKQPIGESSKTKTRKETKCLNNNRRKDVRKESFRTLLSEEVIQQIKKGWTNIDIGDLTIGDLYIMFGKDFKVNLIYSWIDVKKEKDNADSVVDEQLQRYSTMLMKTERHAVNPNFVKNGNELGNKLKQLLLLANLTEKTKRKINCTCERGFKLKNKNDNSLPTSSYVSSKIYPTSQTDSSVFRQPVLPLRGGLSHMEAYRLNMNNGRNKQSRWLKMRNTRPSKQVVVQRLLPLQPGISSSYGLVSIQEEYLKNSLQSNDRDSLAINEIPSLPIKSQLSTILRQCSRSRNNNDIDDDDIDNDNDNDDNDDDNDDDDHDDNRLDDKLDKQKNNNCNGVNENVHRDSAVRKNHMKLSGKCDTTTIKTTKIDVKSSDDNCLSMDPGIKSLMEISLPSSLSAVSESDYIYNSGAPMSPMSILHESPSDPKWFEENVNDFSLSSFLGHLDSACGIANDGNSNCSSGSSGNRIKNTAITREVESSNLSTISETSIDYMSKFVELARSMKNDD